MAGAAALQFPDILGVQSYFDDDADATVAKNVGGGPVRLYGVYVSNTAYAVKVYLKIWNHVNPVVGTTPPNIQIPVPVSGVHSAIWKGGLPLSVGLSYAVTTDAGTAGVANPATPPDVYFAFKPGAAA